MKILTEKDQVLQCPNCKSILQYNKEDLRDKSIPGKRIEVIVCPVCFKVITINNFLV